MKSFVTHKFWKAFDELPDQIQNLARKHTCFGKATHSIRHSSSSQSASSGPSESLKIIGLWPSWKMIATTGFGLERTLNMTRFSVAGSHLSEFGNGVGVMEMVSRGVGVRYDI